jgi:methanogenic corrinoid protein MtbC1
MARWEDDDAAGGMPRRVASPEGVEALARVALERLARRDSAAAVPPALLEGFCTLLAAADYRGAERMLAAATRGRPGHVRMADGILSAAARRLGEKWEADEMSFAEVSIAVAQIFRLNQAFAQRNAPWTRQGDRRLALFAMLPGQVHNLGIVLAAEAFRQQDWQVTLLLDTPGRDILERVRRMRPEAVGLSVSVNDRTHHVEYLLRELRALPLQFAILLGGAGAAGLAARVPKKWRVTVVTDIATALNAV